MCDDRLPEKWYFTYTPEFKAYGVTAIWGYRELVTRDGHFDGIMEREVDELVIFFQRKQEMEAELLEDTHRSIDVKGK